MKIKELFREPKYPIKLFDQNGNEIYSENSNGYWEKYEYNSNGNLVYYEDSFGEIFDDHPKTELTMDEIAKKFDIPINQLKIKKQ